MLRICRLAAAAAAFALGSASTAAAAQPTVALLSPSSSATVVLDGKHTATFSWRITFPSAPTGPTVVTFMVSNDPTFAAHAYTETRTCDPAAPTCFTSTTLQGPGWITAATVAPPQAGTIPLYWRVTAQSDGTTATADGSLIGAATAGPDVIAPEVSVHSSVVRRGTRAKIHFHLADDSDTVIANARLLYHGLTLLTVAHTFRNVTWLDDYIFWFDVPRRVPTGKYRVCVRATDGSGNSSESCAGVTIR